MTQAAYRLCLLGGLRVSRSGHLVHLPASAQRLLALVGLNDHVSRTFAAGTLWPDVPEQRALASLRSAIWRVSQACPGLLTADGDSLELESRDGVDVRELKALFSGMLWHPEREVERSSWAEVLDGDLLPGWYDEWVLVERERLRQMRVHALEVITRSLARRGQYAEALEVGMVGVSIAPLRESAHREIIRIHLAEGNHAEALRQYDVCATLLRTELGLEPSELMEDLVAPLGAGRGPGSR